MSLEHSPQRKQKPGAQGSKRKRREPLSVADPSFTVDEFCAAERMSRSQLYAAWKEKWGPQFYLNGSRRIISHEARLAWKRAREQAAREQGAITPATAVNDVSS